MVNSVPQLAAFASIKFKMNLVCAGNLICRSTNPGLFPPHLARPYSFRCYRQQNNRLNICYSATTSKLTGFACSERNPPWQVPRMLLPYRKCCLFFLPIFGSHSQLRAAAENGSGKEKQPLIRIHALQQLRLQTLAHVRLWLTVLPLAAWNDFARRDRFTSECSCFPGGSFASALGQLLLPCGDSCFGSLNVS